MKHFTEFLNEALNEERQEPRVKVGDNVEVHYKRMNGALDLKGKHKVTKVGAHHFEIDREDSETGKPMKFSHNGYAKSFVSGAKSGKVKGISKSYGYVIHSLTT